MTGVGWKHERARQHSLYPGQREALTRRLEGADNAQIADAMDVSKPTVASYLGGAKVALGADSIDEAATVAQEQGLIPFYREA
ncbi:helix-turn-helix DNA binding domain protein [Streptomyces phage Marky]|nr:helix-turn-helix DNA binding domain protein [Streptomyces phage Marky]